MYCLKLLTNKIAIQKKKVYIFDSAGIGQYGRADLNPATLCKYIKMILIHISHTKVLVRFLLKIVNVYTLYIFGDVYKSAGNFDIG